MIVQLFGFPVTVRHVAAEHQRGVLAGCPTDEGIHVGVSALAVVGVCAVVFIISVNELVIFYLITDVVVAEADVEHQFRCEEVVGQRHVVRLHYGERRIAVGERCRVGAVGVGIELTDARSRDAHGVGQTEVGCRRDVIAHTS